tara:strand:+ start:2367 stop:2582 length:216 start_codon:yes stop_codon:yes gene_type:complete
MIRKRARVTVTGTARFRHWPSTVAPDLEVCEVKSLVGLPKRYLVIQGTTIVSKHRTKQAAVKAAEKREPKE